MQVNRRQFLRQSLAWGLGAATGGTLLSLGGCASHEATAVSVRLTPSATMPAVAAATPAVTATGTPPGTEPALPSPSESPPPLPGTPTSLPTADQAYLASVRGADPAAVTERAIAALGGIERFVRTGDDVILKPNICNAYHGPEYASTTNPEVVAALVRLCLGAGARRVRVMDFPFGGRAEQAYQVSGIEAAVKAAGGEMELMAPMKFRKTDIPEGKELKSWPVYQEALAADVLINVPIAKHHSLAGLTLGIKNQMGLVEDRGQLHSNLAQRLADLSTLFRPALTVVDAIRVLMANGPTGGNLADVKQMDLVIASHDMVAADAFVTRLFGRQPSDIGYIAASADMRLGVMDLSGLNVQELSL